MKYLGGVSPRLLVLAALLVFGGTDCWGAEPGLAVEPFTYLYDVQESSSVAVSRQWLSEKVGWSNADVDLFEVNEAFAVQQVALRRVLELDPEKHNANGGGVALGMTAQIKVIGVASAAPTEPVPAPTHVNPEPTEEEDNPLDRPKPEDTESKGNGFFGIPTN